MPLASRSVPNVLASTKVFATGGSASQADASWSLGGEQDVKEGSFLRPQLGQRLAAEVREALGLQDAALAKATVADSSEAAACVRAAASGSTTSRTPGDDEDVAEQDAEEACSSSAATVDGIRGSIGTLVPPTARSCSAGAAATTRVGGAVTAAGGKRPPVSPRRRLRERRIKRNLQAELREARAAHSESEMLCRHLCRIGEANQWAEEMGLSTRFRPRTKTDATTEKHEKSRSRSRGATVVCEVLDGSMLLKEISLGVFEKRYKALHGQWKHHKAISSKDRGNAMAVTGNNPNPAATAAAGSAAVCSGGGGDVGSKAAPNSNSIAAKQAARALAEEEMQRRIRRTTQEALALADRMRQQVGLLRAGERPTSPFVIH